MAARASLSVVAAALISCATGDPTMPLARGAELVEVRDADTIKSRPVDTSQCRALGEIHVGPVEPNNLEVAIKNATAAKGGDFFFGTAYGGNLAMVNATGQVYRCR